MPNDWYPENGFYETRGQQGEDEWADNAQFDPPSVPGTDTKFTVSSPISFTALTKPASYDF